MGRVQNSSGSGLLFGQSSGSGLIGFANFSKLWGRIYWVSFQNFGFSGLSGPDPTQHILGPYALKYEISSFHVSNTFMCQFLISGEPKVTSS